jgi:hypothetical protein
MSGAELGDRLGTSGFVVVGVEPIKDAARSSSIPVDYIRAVKG